MDDFTKGAAVATLVAYVLGLLATALYLYGLDVSLPELSALKPRFVYTGAVILACIAVGTVIPLLAWTISEPNASEAATADNGPQSAEASSDPDGPEPATVTPPPVSERNWTAAVVFALSMFVLQWLGYQLLLQSDSDSYLTSDAAWSGLWLIVASAGTGLGALATKAVYPSSRGIALVAGLVTAGLLTWFLVSFANRLFPHIPEQYGGAQSRRAQLLIDPDSADEAKALGIRPDVGALSAPLTVLYEGDTFYVLRLDDGRVIQFAKSKILGGTSDSKEPHAHTVRTRDVGGQRGVPEPGDQLILTFSERIAPASIATGWDGAKLPVTIRVNSAPDRATDVVQVMDASRKQTLALGSVEFRSGSSLVREPRFSRAHMTQSGNEVVIALDEPIQVSRPHFGTFLVWIPSKQARDPSGNPAVARAVEEPDDDTPNLKPEF